MRMGRRDRGNVCPPPLPPAPCSYTYRRRRTVSFFTIPSRSLLGRCSAPQNPPFLGISRAPTHPRLYFNQIKQSAPYTLWYNISAGIRLVSYMLAVLAAMVLVLGARCDANCYSIVYIYFCWKTHHTTYRWLVGYFTYATSAPNIC